MTWTLLHFLVTVYSIIPYVMAGNTFSSEPSPDKCLNTPNKLLNQRWACEDPALTFPTVACLAKDILICGKVQRKSCVFYSFGAQGPDARDFCETGLGGIGITFRNALDDPYIKQVINHPRFGDIGLQKLGAVRQVNDQNLNRQNIFVRKLSQAFASVCYDQAYLMVLKYQGRGVGIYQEAVEPPNKPTQDIKDNVWQNDEFPQLTQNDKICRY